MLDDYTAHLQVFQNIKFIAEDHSYLINDSKAISVTSILKQLVKPFDGDYWAQVKSKDMGITTDELKSKWEFNAKLAQIKGTITHEILENKLAGTEFTYPQELILSHFGYDPVQDLVQNMMPLIDKFAQDIDGKMVPVASELIVGDSDYMIGGTVDQIFYNHKSGKLEVWDWKTNKQIKTSSSYYHLPPIDHIADTELDHYSLQLSFYKLILEKNTNLEFGDSYIVWFNVNNNDYQIFRTKDYKTEVETILNHVQ
ncbi:MAG TPA: PD-(D/E)XK nuclease family protein [Aquella sp.]|nr:PD-(D/E)XK nuclease family protein [Aquella sp.]